MKAENKAVILRLLISCLVICGIVGILYLICYLFGWTNLTREEMQQFISSTGAVAPLVFIFVSFLQVTFVPIPGSVTILAGNYLFGAGLSFLYSYIGMMFGSVLAFALGRWIGRPFVNWVTGGSDKTDALVERLKGRENVLLFFMFFLPFFPDDILCSVAGILPVSWRTFIAMQVVTRATSIGATLLFMSGEVIPYHGWGLVVLIIIAVICVVAFVFSVKYAKEINDFFDKTSDKIFKRKDKKENEREKND